MTSAARAEDEQALARQFEPTSRGEYGRYFTPAPLVKSIFERVVSFGLNPDLVVDPACGAGAFLSQARTFFPQAHLAGVELDPAVARHCAERLPEATVRQGDALRGGLELLPRGRCELWIGNPPYNGTSSLLTDRKTYQSLRALLPGLPRGTSLRDDYAFFLLVCARRLQTGMLAFVTSATLLDAFLYAPLRQHLLRTLRLLEVIDLGEGAFADTRVRTCVTFWSAQRGGKPLTSGMSRESLPRNESTEPLAELRDDGPLYRTLRAGRSPGVADFGVSAHTQDLNDALPLRPTAPEWLLRPPDRAAQALDDRWSAEGERLTALVPVSFPGLKTRFDELLVDEEPNRLLARMEAFLRLPSDAFIEAFRIPERCWPKLRLLEREGIEIDPLKVRPFYRYAGAKHRGTIPESARAYCYLDRRLIPRGDHRLQGPWDPHAGRVKLVFNVRELPLSAALLAREGCVHDHRHARFAPLEVPEKIWEQGAAVARTGIALGPNVLNLSARGRAFAKRVGGAEVAFARIVEFINSREVQEVWAPAFGTSRVLPIPFDQM